MRVYMEPYARAFGAGATGGVFRVVQELEKRLPVDFVEKPTQADVTYYHALSTGPRIDVYQNHGIWPNQRDQPDNVKAMNALMTFNIAAASKVISVSKWAAEQYREDLGVTAEIIPNGVDLAVIDTVPRGLFREAHKLGNQPVFLWGKAHLPEDAQVVLDLAKALPEITFITTLLPEGSDPLPNVLVIGRLPYDKMLQALADCDVYISSCRENCPVQLLEVMALGKPCLALDVGGNSEIVLHKKTGYLYQEDVVIGAKYCYKNREKLGQLARKEVEKKYTWDTVIARIYAVLEEAQELRKPHSPRVSVVIPCYNYAHYLNDAVSSVMSNQYKDFEIIIVNDDSI